MGLLCAVSAAHEAAVAAGHPSVTPFAPSASAAPTATATIASPKRPPLVLNKDNPAEAALSRKLSALTSDLQRKQDQINSLNDRKAGGMRQQYDKLVADLLKQQEMLKGKHAELHKKLEESNVRPMISWFSSSPHSSSSCEVLLAVRLSICAQ